MGRYRFDDSRGGSTRRQRGKNISKRRSEFLRRAFEKRRKKALV